MLENLIDLIQLYLLIKELAPKRFIFTFPTIRYC